MRSKFRRQLFESVISLLVGLLAVVVAVLLIAIINNNFGLNKDSQLEKIQSDTEKIKKIVVPYEYKNQLQKVNIIENYKNTTIGGQPRTFFTKQLITNGLFEQGFLYVKASANDRSLLRNDNIYVKLTDVTQGQYHEYGGHLIKTKSLETPKSDSATELLYDLSDIKYKETYLDTDVEVLSADWLKLLMEGENQKIIGFSSTIEKGTIIELSFYYKCVQGQECSISVR